MQGLPALAHEKRGVCVWGGRRMERRGGSIGVTFSLSLMNISRSFDCQEPPCLLPWQPQWSCDHARNVKGETHMQTLSTAAAMHAVPQVSDVCVIDHYTPFMYITPSHPHSLTEH